MCVTVVLGNTDCYTGDMRKRTDNTQTRIGERIPVQAIKYGVAAFGGFAAGGEVVVAEPTIRLIFQQGRFAAVYTQQTALLLRVFLAVVFCWGLQQLIGRAFYARQDTLSPAVLGTLVTLVSLPLFYLLARHLQALGVALASAGSMALYTLVLALWWRHRFGPGIFASLAPVGLKLARLGLLAALLALWVVHTEAGLWGGRPLLGAAYAILASGVAFGLPFVLLAGWLAPALVRPYLERLGPAGQWLRR